MGLSLVLSAVAFVLYPVQIDTGIDSFRILAGPVPVRTAPFMLRTLTSQAAQATDFPFILTRRPTVAPRPLVTWSCEVLGVEGRALCVSESRPESAAWTHQKGAHGGARPLY
jgi:hypothetical protein